MMMNLSPIEVDASSLRGTKADVVISYVSGGEEDYAPWEGKQMGSYGYRTGAAYVFEKTVIGMDGPVEMHEWQQIQKLLGSDTTEEDSFGADISVDGSLLLVGAPHAGDVGKFERQSISCSGATGGTFQLSFRGFTTGAWNMDVTQCSNVVCTFVRLLIVVFKKRSGATYTCVNQSLLQTLYPIMPLSWS